MIFKNMDEVKRHLKIGIPLSCYFIYGTDSQRKRTILNKIVEITTEGGTGFDTHRFTGDVSADTVADAVFEITFGGGRRAVVCEDIPFNAMEENEYKKFEQLIDETAQLGGRTVLIFYFDTVSTEKSNSQKNDAQKSGSKKNDAQKSDTREKNKAEPLKKAIEKNGGGIIKCEYMDSPALVAMIDKICGRNHCEIHRDLCEYMIERCGNDSSVLQNEAKKVSEYKGHGNITKEDIDLVTSATPSAKIYELYNKISTRDRSGAFFVLDELNAMGEAPQMVLFALSSNYIELLRAKTARAEGKTSSDLISDFPKSYSGNRNFLAGKAMTAQRSYSQKAILEALELLRLADIKMKSTGIDNTLILEETVAKLFTIK